MGYWYKLVNGVRKYIVDENGKLINCDHCPCGSSGEKCVVTVIVKNLDDETSSAITWLSVNGVEVATDRVDITLSSNNPPPTIWVEFRYSANEPAIITAKAVNEQCGLNYLGTYHVTGEGFYGLEMVLQNAVSTGIETV